MIRDAEQRLIDMTDRHAGRLRSELAGRVAEAVRDYRRELSAAVDEAVDAIRAAIERATADRRRGEQHARGRLDQLARIERAMRAAREPNSTAGSQTRRLPPAQDAPDDRQGARGDLDRSVG